jgi:hypothetical protein
MMTDDRRADLEQAYLLALMKRDAVIWRAHYAAPMNGRGDVVLSDDNADKPDRRLRDHSATYVREDPCVICGTNKRYVVGRNCVACQTAKEKRAEAAKKAVEKRGPAVFPSADDRPGFRPTQMLSQPKMKATPTLPKSEPPKIKPPKIERPNNILDPNRAAARAAGEAKYIREFECKACHGFEFYTRNATCVECERTRNKKRNSPNPRPPILFLKPVVVPQTSSKFLHRDEPNKERRWARR